MLKVGIQTRGEENRSQCCVYQLYRFSIVSLLRAAGITRILSTRHALYGFLLGLASSCRPPYYVAAQQRFKVVWEAQTSLPLLRVATVASAVALATDMAAANKRLSAASSAAPSKQALPLRNADSNRR